MCSTKNHLNYVSLFENQRDSAVSELIAALLLITVIVGLMAVIAALFMNNPPPVELPHFSYESCIGEDGTIVLLHTGGETLEEGKIYGDYYVNVIDMQGKILNHAHLNVSPSKWGVGDVLSIPIASPMPFNKDDAYGTQIIVRSGGGEHLLQWNKLKGSDDKLCNCMRQIHA